jgi:hypothetical protein
MPCGESLDSHQLPTPHKISSSTFCCRLLSGFKEKKTQLEMSSEWIEKEWKGLKLIVGIAKANLVSYIFEHSTPRGLD